MNWKTQTLLIGAVAGIVVGVLAAFIVVQRAERENTLPTVTAGDGVKIGLGVLGVLRLVADVVDRD